MPIGSKPRNYKTNIGANYGHKGAPYNSGTAKDQTTLESYKGRDSNQDSPGHELGHELQSETKMIYFDKSEAGESQINADKPQSI